MEVMNKKLVIPLTNTKLATLINGFELDKVVQEMAHGKAPKLKGVVS
jgi:hypothetical protein